MDVSFVKWNKSFQDSLNSRRICHDTGSILVFSEHFPHWVPGVWIWIIKFENILKYLRTFCRSKPVFKFVYSVSASEFVSFSEISMTQNQVGGDKLQSTKDSQEMVGMYSLTEGRYITRLWTEECLNQVIKPKNRDKHFTVESILFCRWYKRDLSKRGPSYRCQGVYSTEFQENNRTNL